VLIKSADDKQPDIDVLTALLSRSDLSASTRQKIEQEIRTIGAGIAGEREAAYEINFHYGDSNKLVVIHDLRIEVDGRVAQMDHLLLDRLLDIWVLESKHYAEGVGVNEQGEWVAFWNHHPRGIASPVEQNRRHVAVLRDAFDKGLVNMPRRLGAKLKPQMHSLVLVSSGARISRPKGRAEAARVYGLDTVVKVDQLATTIEKQTDQMSALSAIGSLARLVSMDSLEDLARQLVALHKPSQVDWAARFGLGQAPAVPRVVESVAATAPARQQTGAAPRAGHPSARRWLPTVRPTLNASAGESSAGIASGGPDKMPGCESMTKPLCLRFPVSEVQHLSDIYDYPDDKPIRAIGATAGRRGWYTRDEFLTVMFWKARQRTQALCEQNADTDVVEATRLALATEDERIRMKALTDLHGVGFPAASALLHFARPKSYPILDVRALWSLGVEEPPRFYSFAFWWDYVLTCRLLAKEAGVSLRTFDRSLWKYSKDNQPPITRGSRGRASSKGKTIAARGPTKSDTMRLLFESGYTVVQVASTLHVAYGFAYGVHKRWRESGRPASAASPSRLGILASSRPGPV